MDVVDELMVLLTTELGEFKQEILDEFKKIDFKRDLDLLSTNSQLHLDKEQLQLEISDIKLANGQLCLDKEQLELEISDIKLANNQIFCYELQGL